MKWKKFAHSAQNIISTILSNLGHSVENFIIWYLLQCKKYANMTLPCRGSSSSQFDEDYLTLSLNVSWPFNIVLTSDVMRGYQRVFKLLLHLEKAYIGLQQAFMLLRKQSEFD